MKIAILGLVILLSSFASAQNNENKSRVDIDEMHARKWQSLVNEAHLTSKDIEIVQPVFMSYEKSMWTMHQQNHEFFKSALKNAKKVKPDFADLNDHYVENLYKEAQMFKDYHLQLRKLLQPETLFKYYRAEREYKRNLLQEIQEKHSSKSQDK